MAKSPIAAAPAFRPVAEIIADVLAIEAAGEVNVLSAQAEILSGIIAAIHGKVAPVSAAEFETAWRAPLKAAMLVAKNGKGMPRYSSAGAVSVALTNHKNVILALSHVPADCKKHELLPTDDEANFDLFAKSVRHRLSLPQFGILAAVEPKTPSTPKADQIKALKDQVAKAEATAKAATVHVADNVQPAAKATDNTKATTDLLAKTSAVDLMIGLLRSMNTNCTPEDAQIVMTAMRKNYTMAMSFLKTIAAADPA